MIDFLLRWPSHPIYRPFLQNGAPFYFIMLIFSFLYAFSSRKQFKLSCRLSCILERFLYRIIYFLVFCHYLQLQQTRKRPCSLDLKIYFKVCFEKIVFFLLTKCFHEYIQNNFRKLLDGVFTFYVETKNNWQLTTSLTNEHLHPEFAVAVWIKSKKYLLQLSCRKSIVIFFHCLCIFCFLSLVWWNGFTLVIKWI